MKIIIKNFEIAKIDFDSKIIVKVSGRKFGRESKNKFFESKSIFFDQIHFDSKGLFEFTTKTSGFHRSRYFLSN